jgi:hypothetical protein
MDESFERRKFKRCEVKLPIEVESSDSPIKASSYDLSVGGICVHSKEHFPVNASVHIILSIPIKKEEDVKEIKVIGKVLRVEELSTDNGSINAHGIKFKNIGNEDLIILKNFLKEEYCLEKKTKETGTKPGVLKDENGVEVQGLETEITPIDMPNMSFFQRLFLREDYSILFIEFAKWILKAALLILLFYVSFHMTLLVIKLILRH